MFSKSFFPFLGLVIGGASGGIGGAIIGVIIAAILHGILQASLAKKDKNSELESLINKAENDPVLAEKIHQLAALKRFENINNLFSNNQFMPLISVEEQQAYILLLEFTKEKSLENNDIEGFNQILHMVKSIHFKSNSILGAYLSQSN